MVARFIFFSTHETALGANGGRSSVRTHLSPCRRPRSMRSTALRDRSFAFRAKLSESRNKFKIQPVPCGVGFSSKLAQDSPSGGETRRKSALWGKFAPVFRPFEHRRALAGFAAARAARAAVSAILPCRLIASSMHSHLHPGGRPAFSRKPSVHRSLPRRDIGHVLFARVCPRRLTRCRHWIWPAGRSSLDQHFRAGAEAVSRQGRIRQLAARPGRARPDSQPGETV